MRGACADQPEPCAKSSQGSLRLGLLGLCNGRLTACSPAGTSKSLAIKLALLFDVQPRPAHFVPIAEERQGEQELVLREVKGFEPAICTRKGYDQVRNLVLELVLRGGQVQPHEVREVSGAAHELPRALVKARAQTVVAPRIVAPEFAPQLRRAVVSTEA
eukprot:scaffold19667_cov70-Phaeocystis_antarctica.AAC.1